MDNARRTLVCLLGLRVVATVVENSRATGWENGAALNKSLAALSLFHRSEKARDPRQEHVCKAAAYTTTGVAPSPSEWLVMTVEDVLANRSNPSSAAGLGRCPTPYLRLLPHRLRTTSNDRQVLYIEVPKTASSFIKTWIGASIVGGAEDAGAIATAIAQGRVGPSFIIVREPLDRMLSAYSTILAHSLKLQKAMQTNSKHTPTGGYVNPAFMRESDPITRFSLFVDTVITHGDALIRDKSINPPKGPCLWGHALTQMKFLNLWPNEIDFVAHVETLADDMKVAGQRLGFNATGLEELSKVNVNPGGIDKDELKAGAPEAIAKLLDYLRQDYACLGYDLPPMP